MNFPMQSVVSLQTKAALKMQKEARRLKTEFKEYLDDLELFSKPTFWKAIANEKNAKSYSSLREFRKKTGL